MIVPPGLSRPVRSASSIIFTAMRSLIELPGLNVSSFATTVTPVMPRVILLMRTIGVWPMTSRMLEAIFVIVLQVREVRVVREVGGVRGVLGSGFEIRSLTDRLAAQAQQQERRALGLR